MNDANFDKWISGETDTFFNPGKNGVLLRWCGGFASRQRIAIVLAAVCVLSVTGFSISRTSSSGRNEISPSAHSSLPPMTVVVPPRPEPLPTSGKASAHSAEFWVIHRPILHPTAFDRPRGYLHELLLAIRRTKQ